MSRHILTLVAIPVKHGLSKSQSPLLQTLQRNLNTHSLSPTITLISNGHTKHLRNRPDLSQYSSEGKPLSILLCWLMAKNNAVKKYAQFYLEHGFDVLTVRITPTQLLLPKRTEPIVLNELLPTLFTSDHSTKLVHGFSVGGYVFARMLKYLYEHPEGDQVLNTIKAQIWDSVVDVNGVSIGVSKSVFGKNATYQQALQAYIEFHMKAFYQIATKYYEDAHEVYYNKPLKAPALFFGSELDQISTIDVVENVQEGWKKMGIPCTHKLWNDTQHVGHMRVYPDQYQGILKDFLQRHGVHKTQRVRQEEAAQDINSGRREIPIPHGIPNVVYSKAV